MLSPLSYLPSSENLFFDPHEFRAGSESRAADVFTPKRPLGMLNFLEVLAEYFKHVSGESPVVRRHDSIVEGHGVPSGSSLWDSCGNFCSLLRDTMHFSDST